MGKDADFDNAVLSVVTLAVDVADRVEDTVGLYVLGLSVNPYVGLHEI